MDEEETVWAGSMLLTVGKNDGKHQLLPVSGCILNGVLVCWMLLAVNSDESQHRPSYL